MKIIVSNRLEVLAKALGEELFQKKSHPLEKRFVIVPSERIHQELCFGWASDRDLQVATGFHMLTWRQALCHLFPAIPSSVELSLRIEGVLKTIEPLMSYLSQGGVSREASLCDKMSALFLEYMALGEDQVVAWLEQAGWQQELWRKVFGNELPWKNRQLLQGNVYLFHPSQLSGYQLKTFQDMGATVFLFSPCQMYWGDLKTPHEKQYFMRKARGRAREELDEYFSQDNPLLAKWGRTGRALGRLFEEEEVEEGYEIPQNGSLLAAVQEEILTLEVLKKPSDNSLQIHAVSSKRQEVEVVWEIIQQLPFEPKDILVLAPEMHSYGALVELIFRERGGAFDFAIFSLEAYTKNPFMQGLQDLLELLRYRFSKETMDKLLSCPPFLQRFGFDKEEAELLQRWMSRVHIRYDLTGNHDSTWKAGLKRLVEALVLPVQENHLVIDFSRADLLSRWIDVINLLTQELQGLSEIALSMGQWMRRVRSWMELFFAADPDDELMRQLERFQKMSVEGVFPFSTLERLLQGIFHQTSGAVHGSHLQAVRFSSLERGGVIPAKVIILMGMCEGAFPRREAPTSLEQLPISRKSDEDRYLFLEALCSAREQFIITYSYLHPEDGKSQKASPLVEELRHYLNLSISQHPAPSHFEVEQTTNIVGELPLLQPSSWDIQTLKRLARHPLQFFFEERLGIDFDWKEQDCEFTLSHLEMSRLRKGSLKKPLEALIREMKEEGKLPVGSFSGVAVEKVHADVEEYHAALEKLQVKPREIYAVELKLSCQNPTRLDDSTWVYPALHLKLPEDRDVVIQGRIEDLSPQGLLFHGDDTLADLLKVWPLYLVVQQLFPALPLLLTKKGKAKTISPPQKTLERYLLYGEKALRSPSPLFPKWARSIFKEGKIPQPDEDDSVIHWIQSRGLLPSQEKWLEEWRFLLNELL